MVIIDAPNGYLSIPPFERIELPDLTVLVGLNGSGKTQLLEGIANGNVSCPTLGVGRLAEGQVTILRNGDDVPAPFSENVGSRLGGVSPINPGAGLPWVTIQEQTLAGYDQLRKIALDPFEMAMEQAMGVRLSDVANGEDFWRLDLETIISRAVSKGGVVNVDRISEIYGNAELSITAANPRQMNNLIQVSPAIRMASDKLRKSPLKLTRADIEKFITWTTVDPFQPPIVQFFARYRDLRMSNDLKQKDDFRQGTSLALSDEEFKRSVGRPPWEILSESLEAFGLEYLVAEPSGNPSVPVQFVLKRRDNGLVISVNGLSSGERVLIRLALSLIEFNLLQVSIKIPSIVLLDEMDASLHPQMVSRWLNAIEHGVVSKLGVKCILTTHSPITVALAPDNALYEMTAGSGGPRSISKQQALNKLTVGLPTLSIDYSGRRQVFVESDTDAASFEALATIMKAKLQLPRTLSFVSTGYRKKNRLEVGTGSAAVKRLVNSLADNGATTVYGIVDWDAVNEPSNAIHVIGHNVFYALDNILLDPLLVGALMLRHKKELPGINFTFGQIGSLSHCDLEKISQAMQNLITLPDGSDISTSASYFYGDLSLSLPRAYQRMKGHDLEDLVASSHPRLDSFHRSGAGKLTFAVVDDVIRDYPFLCPKPIADLLVALARE